MLKSIQHGQALGGVQLQASVEEVHQPGHELHVVRSRLARPQNRRQIPTGVVHLDQSQDGLA